MVIQSRKMASRAAVVTAFFLMSPAPALCDTTGIAGVRAQSFEIEYGASVFNEDIGFIRAHALNLGWSYRISRLSVGAQTGLNVWQVPLLGSSEEEHMGTLNLGPKVEWRSLAERVRSQLGVGMSLVIEPSVVDARAGAVGWYVDARPLGLRFPVENGWVVGFDPLGSALRVPDTSGVPLVEVQFLTFLRLECER